MDEDLAIPGVCDRPHRSWHIRCSNDLESEVLGKRVHLSFGQGALSREPDSINGCGSDLLDVCEVVPSLGHLCPQLGVHGSSLVASERSGRITAAELFIQRHDVLERSVGNPRGRLQVWKTKIAIGLVLLCPLDGNLEFSPMRRGLR